MPLYCAPVEPRTRLEPASEFRLYAHTHASIISFKDDTFPLQRLRLPDASSRLKVLRYCRLGSTSVEAEQPHHERTLEEIAYRRPITSSRQEGTIFAY
jgi:hypothetical protein